MTVTIEKSGPLAVPLADLKAYLSIALDDEDEALTELIRTATETAERFLGQMLIARTVTETLGARQTWQALSMRPVRAITAVIGVPADGVTFTLPVENYAVDIDASGTGLVRISNAGSAGRVRLTYTAGVADDGTQVPDSIQHAIIRMAGELHARRDGLEADLPVSVATMLRPWRRMQLA